MIVSEKLNERLIRHKSDDNKFILQVETGLEYIEAVDVIPCRFTYEETDKEIPKYNIKEES